MNDLNNSHILLNNAEQDRQDTLVCQGCVLYKVKNWNKILNDYMLIYLYTYLIIYNR